MAESYSFPYAEPGIVTVLLLSSFLLILNIVNWLLDKIVYCGLLGQILVGVWYGTPGAGWLGDDFQHVTQQLGYIGLILLIYEGGLSTNLGALKSNLILSSAVAITGIAAPIALSFLLQTILDITPLQAFAAGAALCSTSLGTTFTVLSTSGLVESRLGVVLTSAAVIDDVVGLVILQVISTLGAASSGGLGAPTIVRPILVSIAFAVVVPLVCVWIIGPTTRWWLKQKASTGQKTHTTWLGPDYFRFVGQTLVLVGMVVGATYAGTSGLFAAYLAGICVSWSDSLVTLAPATDRKKEATSNVKPDEAVTGSTIMAESAAERSKISHHNTNASENSPASEPSQHKATSATGLQIYDKFYKPSFQAILKPLFFASIGFAIPITEMFTGPIVWRGIIYTLLMVAGKLICGVWLLRVPFLGSSIGHAIWKPVARLLKLSSTLHRKSEKANSKKRTHTSERESESTAMSNVASTTQSAAPASRAKDTKAKITTKSASTIRPLSLYPSALLGGAMVARGEIGFLISSIAQSNGLFTDELFLVVTWAIFLCTFIGPLMVGLLVRRVRRLQEQERNRATGRDDPLGTWGVSGLANKAAQETENASGDQHQ